MENNRYTNINELISDIEALGDWRDVSQRSNFLKVLSKIAMLYYGYEIKNENGETTRGYYPKEVTAAIVEACRAKFPNDDKEVFDEEGNLKEGYPEYSNLLFLVKDALGISILGERTGIGRIASEEFGINVYNGTTTREEVDELVKSSKEYYEKIIKEKKKNAVQVEVSGNLEMVVENLLKFKERGESVYVVFNGDKLYSCDVTMDSAFLRVTGITKREMENYNRELNEASKGIDIGDVDEETKKEIKAREEVIRDKYKKIEQEHIKEAKEEAVHVKIYLGNLDNAVAYLKECRANGDNVYIDFNGHRLYSIDTTMDKAYKEVTGKTKDEYDKALEEWRKRYKEKQEQEKAEAEAKIPEWIKKGEKFIYPERMEEWEKCVGTRVSDLYNGIELDFALDLMEELDSGASMEEVKEKFENQINSGASYDIVKSIVLHFSKRGPEFYESIADGELTSEEQKVIEDIKRKNKAIESGIYEDKKSKEDAKEKNEELERELTYAEQQKLAEEKIPEWIAKGEALISKEKRDEWKKYVEAKARGMFLGLSLDETIELLDRLEKGESFESLTKLIKEDETRQYIGAVWGVLKFSEKGPEFTEYFEKAIGEYTPDVARRIEKVRTENAERHKDDSTREISPERKQEEAELAESFAKKKQLTAEIAEIEQQLAVLRLKEEELKKTLLGKREELKNLEEK